MKMVPKGLSQSRLNLLHPRALEMNAQIMPSAKPMNICQCNASFRIGQGSEVGR